MPQQSPLIVNVAQTGDSSWRFFEPHLGNKLRWKFVEAEPSGAWAWLRRIRKPHLGRIKSGLEAAYHAGRKNAALVVSHGPLLTQASAFFLRRRGYRGPHLAFSFNYTTLPTGVRRSLMSRAAPAVDRFVVYSSMERQLYHEAIGIPLEKIDFIHWGSSPPGVASPDRPSVPGDYICALGENARDYRSLFKAMEALPHIKLVVVARPYNLSGLSIPSNVQIRTNIPHGDAMNILAHSQFMVLPLAGSEIPCGHVTLVSAMHLGKAFIISNSSGVADYVQDGRTAIACEAFSADALEAAVRRLWDDRPYRDRLAHQGRAFATEFCSEANTLAWFRRYLTGKGLLSEDTGTG